MWMEKEKRRLEERLEIYENSLQALMEQLKALSRQLSYEINEQHKVAIKRQLKSVEEEIAEVVHKQRATDAELQSLIEAQSKRKNRFAPVAVLKVNESTNPSPQPSGGRISRTILQAKSEPKRKEPAKSALLNNITTWRYALYVGMAILLAVQWLVIKNIAINAIDFYRDDIPNDSISAHLSKFGATGGAATALLLYLHTCLHRYFQQRHFTFSWVRLFFYAAVGITTGALLWYVPEALLYNGGEGDPLQYTNGTEDSVRFCIVFSFLGLLLSAISSRLRRSA